MRADRLLSMLMILQSQGKVTARDLASELEVSERTVHRDVIALSAAGVPVYTERGPGGGIALVEKYKSDLTGLTKEEVHALFMMSIPPAMADLGLDQELRAAMLKLSASLPSTMRNDEREVRQRIHIDPIPREAQPTLEALSTLQILQDSLWELRALDVRYRSWLRPDLGPLQVLIHPYGLVAKAGHWYLVGKQNDHIGVLRVDQILEAHVLEQTFKRPDDFDLKGFWGSYRESEMQNRPVFPVLARADVGSLSWLSWSLGDKVQVQIREERSPDAMGRITIELRFEYLEQALKDLLPLGSAVEVIEPIALRYTIKDYAEQILMRYV